MGKMIENESMWRWEEAKRDKKENRISCPFGCPKSWKISTVPQSSSTFLKSVQCVQAMRKN